jgi:DNA-binding CsgD family transcriptional regulator
MPHPPQQHAVGAHRDGPSRADLLTRRERAVLAHVLKGASSKEIAHTLRISPRTVEFHRANIMKKFAANNVVELVRKIMSRTA